MKFLLICLLVAVTLATYITHSKIEACTQKDVDAIDCSEKASIGIAVSFGLSGSRIEGVTINELNKDGEPQQVEQPVVINLKKTLPELLYPLVYYHTVAYYPTEEVIKVQNSFGIIQKCVDSAKADYPTCGWTYAGSRKIPDSQGFCCNKEMNMFTDQSWWRGEAVLKEQANFFNQFSTGHCLRLGKIFFHGYEIDTSVEKFDIEITIDVGANSHTFTLSPAVPIYNSISDSSYRGDFKMQAELVGDFAAYTEAPDLSNYILYMPGSPDDHTFVIESHRHMLLVPREETGKSGDECNKIGVSFAQFRREHAYCSTSRVGDCLHNQLFHKHNSDMERLALFPDLDAKYLVHGKKVFKGSMKFYSGMEKQLKYAVTSIKNSLVSLTMSIDNIKVVTQESLGIIVDAWVKDFESMSRNGQLYADVENVGDLDASYVVTVADCNMNIQQSVPAQARDIPKGSTEQFEFNIYTTQNLDATNYCWVTLNSQRGNILDRCQVIFDTFKHRSDYSYDLQEKNEGGTIGKDKTVLGTECDCELLDIPCKFLKMCWVDIIIMVLIILGIIACIIGTIIFFIAGGGQFLPMLCCSLCNTLKCCLGCVGCFTKFFIKESMKRGKKKRKHKHKHRHHKKKHHHHKKKHHHHKKQKKHHEKSYKTYRAINEDDVDDVADNTTVLYMNISSKTELGKEMLKVMKKAMPLKVKDDFCLVGTLRQKGDNYQFIIHEDLLEQTWYYDGEWKQCDTHDDTEQIPDKYRGYSLQLEHVTQCVTRKPGESVVINQPLEL